jgi:hypothetical protein
MTDEPQGKAESLYVVLTATDGNGWQQHAAPFKAPSKEAAIRGQLGALVDEGKLVPGEKITVVAIPAKSFKPEEIAPRLQQKLVW